MTQKEKLLGKFLENPKSLKYREIEMILKEASFVKVSVRGGSHAKFKHDLLDKDLVIPVHNNDCKDFYKQEALKQAKEVFKKLKR